MEELEITIEELKTDKQDLEIKVTDFSRYGRSPNDADYVEMISLLENWFQIKSQIECLEELQKTIISNQKK
jgi:hypothetical protein